MRFLSAAGLVMILSGLGAYYATGQLSPYSILNLSAGPLLLMLGVAGQVRRFRGFTGARSRSEVLRWAGIGGAVLAAVTAANLLGGHWQARIDLTASRRYTLSPQTFEECRHLAAGREKGAFELILLEDALLGREIRPLTRAYEAACPGLEVRRMQTADVPPEARPVLQVMDATVILCRAGRCEGAGFPSEENITNALVRLSRERKIEVCFLVGHGEVDLASTRAQGFSDLAGLLRDEGLEVRALVGPATREVPESCDVLIAAAPERDLLDPERAALDRYLRGGGRLLALLEPGVTTNLDGLLEDWGFGLPAGVLVDRATSPLLEDPSPVTLLVNSFDTYHPVTRPLGRRTMLLVPGARAVLPVRKPGPHDRLVALAYTSPTAWLESDVRGALGGRSVRRDAGEPGDRELPLAAAGRYPRGDQEARIVVIGDRDLASNRLLHDLYNRDLLMNAVLWLGADEQRITIRPKVWTPDQDPLTLQQTLAYFYFMAFALPEVLLLLGIHAWYRQRRR